MKDNKYIVLKRDEIGGELLEHADAMAVEDAVVIRRQDMFAAPALDSYANSIIAAIESMKCVKDRVGKLPMSIGLTIDRLQEIADYFHGQASLSWQIDRKLPD